MAVPSICPKHVILVLEELTEISEDSKIVTGVTKEQPLESIIVQLYAPAFKLFAICVVCDKESSHK